ncbi:MAG: histidinol-phosphate transaminase [Gammaproteobacteria bacterium HGW-Gammaproteobacteria-8]|nr:MAG: histidinol-phosphate transaminase [Gammaproteobacteria bacterium HGW-Gammaproteobacteria-8]
MTIERLDYQGLANAAVAALQPYTPGKPIAELEREYGVRDSIKLASNENPLGASPLALAAIRNAVDDLWLYPDANGYELKQALAGRHGLTPECITLANGSNDVLVFLAQVFLGPGLKSLFSQYCFAVYPIATQLVGAEADVAPALPAEHPVMPLGHDLRELYRRVDGHTRMVWIANPNNPTGTWLEQDRMLDFLSSLPGHVICVVDEAYSEYAESNRLGDASRWLERFPNLVVTRTFSKAYGLAGLRVGYALSNPGIADLLNRVRPAFNVNALGLVAARAALDDHEFIERSRAVNAAGLIQLRDGLEHLGCRVLPSAANFVLAEFDRPAAELNQALLRRGIIVRPVGNYGLDRHLRITVGSEAQNQRLLGALESILSTGSPAA